MTIWLTSVPKTLWLPLSLSVASIGFTGCLTGDNCGRGQKLPTYKRMVNYSDLEDRIEVIGRLGVPLGQFVNVRGTWVPNVNKGGSDLNFQIEAVDGHKLEAPVILTQAQMRDWDHFRGAKEYGDPYVPLVFAAGETWDMRGFESAWTVGYPPGVSVKAGENADGDDPNHKPYEIESRFGYLTATLVKPEKNN